ncbi:MAG: RNA polymerase subunit sigma-70, partial [Lysinibacillus sp.]
MKTTSGLFTSLMQLWIEIPALLGYIKGKTFHKPFSKEEEAA